MREKIDVDKVLDDPKVCKSKKGEQPDTFPVDLFPLFDLFLNLNGS